MTDNEKYWHEMLTEGNAVLDKGRAVLSLIPSDSRCMFCHGPFEGFGGRVMSLMGKGQAREDPRVCNSCVKQGQRHPGGAYVDLATVFADMRGSTGSCCPRNDLSGVCRVSGRSDHGDFEGR